MPLGQRLGEFLPAGEFGREGDFFDRSDGIEFVDQADVGSFQERGVLRSGALGVEERTLQMDAEQRCAVRDLVLVPFRQTAEVAEIVIRNT